MYRVRIEGHKAKGKVWEEGDVREAIFGKGGIKVTIPHLMVVAV